jgi:putative ATP-dependent endonuclease of OLD family
MYLSRLKLWDFRKFGSANVFNINEPNLDLPFSPGNNLLIGENDSGKTAIIDAIKLILNTYSYEANRIDELDFYTSKSRLRIECYFEDFTNDEAKNFIEWLGWKEDNGIRKPTLKLILDVSRTADRILSSEVKAGADEEGSSLSFDARQFLRATYLRPLRDARSELTPRKNSRLSQVLLSHDAFRQQPGIEHDFVQKVKLLNSGIVSFFDGKDADGNDLDAGQQQGKELKSIIDTYLTSFLGKRSKFGINGDNLRNILESLFLIFESELNLGLGSHNLLCIAAELLHLEKIGWQGLRLGLIEEIEAHLHPQVQLQVIETLQKEVARTKVQLILTTHSPNIGSKVPLNNIIICNNGKAFPMGEQHTMLNDTDYSFLQRFLDVTKANLFFAKGVILVEGWGEELLLPTIASKMGISLTRNGVSVVNIGNTAFLRYCRVFQRSVVPYMDIPVAVTTDADIPPLLYGAKREVPDPANPRNKIDVAYTAEEIRGRLLQAQSDKAGKYDGQSVKTFVSDFWTLEYCIALSPTLRQLFFKSVLQALREQKVDDAVQDLKDYDDAIANCPTHFNNWGQNAEEIAYQIMDQILNGNNNVGVAKMKVSKSIIGQIFAKNLAESNDDFDLENQQSIKYLLNAIRYATGN